MAFNQACTCYLYEFCICAKLFNAVATHIAHTGAKTAHHLEYGVADRSLIRHTAFNTFRNELFGAGLEISVCRAFVHCAERAHAAINLKLTTLINFRISG